MKYERPLRRPSQMVEGVPPEAPAAQPQTVRHGGSAKALSAYPCGARRKQQGMPPKPPPHNRKPRGTAGAWKEAEGRTPTAGRGIVRRPAACIRLSPLGAVSAHAAQQSVGRLRTALRQGGIASLARDNPISRPRVQRPRLRRHRPLSGAHRPFGEGRIEEIRGHDLLQ